MTEKEVQYKIGQIVTGKVNGIQNYGVFVELDEGNQGLVHVSELTHGFVDDIHSIVKIGDVVEAKIIDIDEYTQKISLSLRALIPMDVPKKVNYRKKPRRRKGPDIGFSSLEKKLPQWIDKFSQEIEENK